MHLGPAWILAAAAGQSIRFANESDPPIISKSRHRFSIGTEIFRQWFWWSKMVSLHAEVDIQNMCTNFLIWFILFIYSQNIQYLFLGRSKSYGWVKLPSLQPSIPLSLSHPHCLPPSLLHFSSSFLPFWLFCTWVQSLCLRVTVQSNGFHQSANARTFFLWLSKFSRWPFRHKRGSTSSMPPIISCKPNQCKIIYWVKSSKIDSRFVEKFNYNEVCLQRTELRTNFGQQWTNF